MKTRNTATRHRRNAQSYFRGRGIFILDAVIGLAILAALMAITAVTLGYDHRAQRAAIDHRRLTTAAEQAMLTLQLGQPADDAAREATADAEAAGHTIRITFERLPDGDTPDGRTWIHITASQDGQSVQLVGLVSTETADTFDAPDAADVNQADADTVGDAP